MRPVRLQLTSATQTIPIPMDRRVPPMNCTIQVILSNTPVLTYTVEYTTDDIQVSTYNPATGNWFPVPGFESQTESARNPLPGPVTAVRLKVTAYTSGTAEIDVLQSGP